MRVLRQGLQGDDVKAWEYFLTGLGSYGLDIDGVFDEATKNATINFQHRHAVGADGVVGMSTYAVAHRLGFNPLEDDDTSENGPNWPPKPTDLQPLTGDAERAAKFERFNFVPSPTPTNREGITITDGWAQRNIVLVELPLDGVVGGAKRVPFHRAVADSVKNLFLAWQEAELLPLLKTWGGSWVPRFTRGSTTSLSNHAYGSAFDINVPWNGLGAQPALADQQGSVRKLVPIANALGWWWGGHGWPGSARLDGMHFEASASVQQL